MTPANPDALADARDLIRQSLKVGAPGLSEAAREAVVRSIMLKLEGKVLAPLLTDLQRVTAERDAEYHRANKAIIREATAEARAAQLQAEVGAKDSRIALADRVKAQLEVAQNALAKIDRGGKPMREIAARALLDVAMVPYPAETEAARAATAREGQTDG